MDTFNYLLSWVWWFLGLIASGLNALFGLPFVGWFIQFAFYVAILIAAYKLYRWLVPERVQTAVKKNVRPAASWMTTPMRWYLVQWLANPEWLRQPGDPAPKIEERIVEVRVPRRRTVGQVLKSGVRWGVVYASAYLIIANWTTIISIFDK
jgi:hypothetical protein